MHFNLQLESLSVPFLPVEDLTLDISESFDILVDAIFGFSFLGINLILALLFEMQIELVDLEMLMRVQAPQVGLLMI